MKPLLLTLLSFCFLTLTAQSTIDASELIAQLNNGDDIMLEGVTIEGDLDFTSLENSVLEANSNWSGKNKSYRSTVTSRLEFKDCTFKGEVLGFRNESSKWGWEGSNGPVYHADFREAVIFEDCRFKEDASFKYSKFREEVSFRGSELEDVSFKYSKFGEAADFSGTEFEDVTFKYTKFQEFVDFSAVDFNDTATFKYTKFPRGVDFSRATFHSSAQMKYTEFSEPSKFDGTDFGSNPDFKYTKMEGKNFTSYLLSNRRG